MKSYLSSFLIFILIQAFYPTSCIGENAELKIVQIKINDKVPIWPAWKAWSFIKYTKLNKDGLPENLEILNDVSKITFRFDYTGIDKPQFRYTLKGYENQWHIIDSCQILNYDGIKHSRYTLFIQASKNKQIIKEIKFNFFNNISGFWIYSDFVNLLVILILLYITIKME
jgi:hypothetical protein